MQISECLPRSVGYVTLEGPAGGKWERARK
jgi:hypothetical protein